MSERDDHLAIDERIGLRLPDAPLTRLLGTVSEVLEGDPVAMVFLSGTDTPVPIWFPALPVTLVAGDKVAIEKKQPGWLMITHVLGRSGDLGGGSASFDAVETLGDLLVGTGPGTVDNLGVGSDGQVLTANSGAPLGVAWAAATSSFFGARIHRTASQANIAESGVAVTFPTGSVGGWEDGGDFHDPASNSSRLTIPVGTPTQKYLVSCGLRLSAINTTGRRAAYIRVNGTTVIAEDGESSPSGSIAGYFAAETPYILAASDYVEMIAFQTSGLATTDVVAEGELVFLAVVALR